MKKVICCMLALLLVCAAGCKKKNAAATTAATTTPATTQATTPAAPQEDTNQPVIIQEQVLAVGLPLNTEELKAADGTVIYQETWSHMTLTMGGQATAELIINDFMNRVTEKRDSAETLKELAQERYAPSDSWIPLSFDLRYEPTRVDPNVLSVYGVSARFSGGSHPDYTCVSANYNLISGDPLTLGSILDHEDQVPVLRDLVIAKLDAQAEEKYLDKEQYQQLITERFNGNESYDEDWYFSETGLCFYFSPYEIAPYSSGIITAEIPYSELTGVIADEFFPPEYTENHSQVTVVPFQSADADKYDNMCELTLDVDGDMYFVETGSMLTNVRVCLQTGTEYAQTKTTVFGAYFPGDAIMIQASAENAANITIEYTLNGETVSVPLIAN